MITRWEKNESWNAISKELMFLISDSHTLRFEHDRIHADLTKKIDWGKYSFDRINLFLLSYIVSELSDDEAMKVARMMKPRMDFTLSAVLVNDRQNDYQRKPQDRYPSFFGRMVH
jgi:hypothetical protein